MVNRFEKLTKDIAKKYKDTSLLAFLKMDDNLESWTMIYSSPKVLNTEEGKEFRRELFSDFAKLLRDSVVDKKSEIGRMGVFQLDNHIVMDALNYKAGTHITESTRMNGNIISEGYITISNS